MVNLAHGLTKRGLEVDMVLAYAEGPYLGDLCASVRIIDLRASRVLYSTLSLVRYLRQERPQALVSALDHANVIALMARKLSGIPLKTLVSVQNTLSPSTMNAGSRRNRLLPYLLRTTYPWADIIGAVSEGVAEDLIHFVRMPANKVRVVHNPVVTTELYTKASVPLGNHPWFAPDQPPVVLGIGRLTAQKDFCTLIKAFAILRQVMPARLIILGEGECRSELERLVQRMMLTADVALPGFVANPYSYIRQSAAFVLSSRWEGLPTVLIEALAVGATVVSTDCPSGPAEILEGGRWGHLVPVGDADALAAAIWESLTSACRDKEAARRSVQERYGEDEIAHVFEETLLHVA
jgi:glycosyltransferase involved in cell wall biosynthesis